MRLRFSAAATAVIKSGLLAGLVLGLPAAAAAQAPAPAVSGAAAPAEVALPGTLKAARGLATAPGTLLRWATDSEASSARFVVERSVAGGAFEAIGAVAAAGTGSGRRAYRFDDVAAPAAARYRLRLENQDGTVAYSAAVAATNAAGVAAR